MTIAFGAAATLYQRRKDTATALLALGTAFLIVVAVTHVFESFGLLSTFRWGQPDSVGHYIDLGAALLGVMFVLSALVTVYVKRDQP
jgi:hypothetical protein